MLEYFPNKTNLIEIFIKPKMGVLLISLRMNPLISSFTYPDETWFGVASSQADDVYDFSKSNIAKL